MTVTPLNEAMLGFSGDWKCKILWRAYDWSRRMRDMFYWFWTNERVRQFEKMKGVKK